MGERLFEEAAEPKHFYPMPGWRHRHPSDPAFFAAVREFLDETRAR
jgi:hypothetical protein